MIRNRLYYSLKPLLPWRLRMELRRRLVQYQLKRSAGVWPICPGSERPPEGWPGWPDQKQFAFVLTHDVEGTRGLQKVRALAELEMSLGFRSSFNFVPEGEYTVPAELIAWLTKNGFEVGVHDLHHDGKLYASREEFAANGQRINSYLKDWQAVGFRSGFMLSELEWLHDLNILYDASTFDTDPFEPRPQGQRTIFPFWVHRPAQVGPGAAPHQPGYVELPYTLPQDSTMFLLLREPTPAIWFRKLEWLVQNRGMALVNVHPDYVRLDDEPASARTFPKERYSDFLKHVSERYSGTYWHGLPKQLARWATDRLPAARQNRVNGVRRPTALKGKTAAVLLYSYYPSDPRPRREAEALVQEGLAVDLICLQESADEPKHEVINGVNVRRLPLRRSRESRLNYLYQYGAFTTLCGAILTGRTFRKRYDLVHVHNMPDLLVMASLFSKLCGARVILDLHDPMPELMMTIYDLRQDRPVIGALKFFEKLSIAVANRVVTVNLACKKIFGARSCAPEKIQVVMNSPDEGIFQFRPVPGGPAGPRDATKPFVLMCHGSIVERHGHDLAVAAVQRLRKQIPGIQLRIYGRRTPYLDQVMADARSQGLEGAVQYLGAVTQEGIVKAILECDLGVIPNRRAIFTELNTPTRIFEYLACGVPVISPRAPGILDYFSEEQMLFFDLGDTDDLARAILEAYQQPERVREVARRGQEVYRSYQWSEERARFVNMVEGLLVPAADRPTR